MTSVNELNAYNRGVADEKKKLLQTLRAELDYRREMNQGGIAQAVRNIMRDFEV